MSFDTIAATPVGMYMLEHLVHAGFAGARPLTDVSEAELYEVVAHAAAEVSEEKWSPEPRWPWQLSDYASADAIERLAQAVPACAAAKWWSAAVTHRPQVWLGRAAAAPTSGVLAGNIEGKPRTEIWTSSAVAGLPSAWWPYLARGGERGAGQCSIWRLTPHPDVRVFEIRDPADWRWLCETFPGPVVRGWATPGWESAAEHFDGIHLTVEGLIRAQGVEIQTENGPAKLDDWDAESTAWMRWEVVDLERLGTVGTPRREPAPRRGRSRMFPPLWRA